MAITYSSANSSTAIKAGDPGGSNVPSAIIESGNMSTTSLASECFVNQKFSNKLQAFLIGYVNLTFSTYPIYK